MGHQSKNLEIFTIDNRDKELINTSTV